MASEKKIERVSRAICSGARMFQGAKCPICEQDSPVNSIHNSKNCTLWPQFRQEALNAIREIER